MTDDAPMDGSNDMPADPWEGIRHPAEPAATLERAIAVKGPAAAIAIVLTLEGEPYFDIAGPLDIGDVQIRVTDWLDNRYPEWADLLRTAMELKSRGQ